MNDSEANEVFDAAYDAWESGDFDDFVELAGAYNAYLSDEGYSPMMPEDWYPGDIEMSDAMWEWVDSLSHEDRDAFFGY